MTTIPFFAGIVAFSGFWLLATIKAQTWHALAAYALLAATTLYLVWTDGTTASFYLLGQLCLAFGLVMVVCEFVMRWRGGRKGWLFKNGAVLLIIGLLLMTAA